MSGTSADAIDAVAASFGRRRIKILAARRAPLPPEIQSAIHALCAPGADEIDRSGALDVALGELFAQAALAAMNEAGLSRKDIAAIGSHGQTIRHRPHPPHRFTLQIGNPAVIAHGTGITTISNFRARDLAAGGQGAPLVPAFHAWLFQSPDEDRAIVNIGGIANMTVLPAGARKPVLGFDTGPGNTLLDAWVRRHLERPFDRDGAWAASGEANEALLDVLLADPYFKAPPPKSTGREHFHLAWLDQCLRVFGRAPFPQDVQATLALLTARSIAGAVERWAPRSRTVFVCGGGAHNAHLMQRLASELGDRRIDTTARLGLPPDWVEAAAFAWLAMRTLEGKPGNLPSVTGAAAPVILGGVYRA